jgi:hypothetical protein
MKSLSLASFIDCGDIDERDSCLILERVHNNGISHLYLRGFFEALPLGHMVCFLGDKDLESAVAMNSNYLEYTATEADSILFLLSQFVKF